jgi:hypothetical protein
MPETATVVDRGAFIVDQAVCSQAKAVSEKTRSEKKRGPEKNSPALFGIELPPGG